MVQKKSKSQVIRLAQPLIDECDNQAISDVIQSGYLVQGKKVAELEMKIADYVGTKHAVALNSCTSALHVSLLSLGCGPGDIVIVPAYSWISTANVVCLCNAKPVFTDISPDTFNMDIHHLAKILQQLSQNSSTAKNIKAIIPVHAFGQMAHMSEIIALSEEYNVPVIEDAACALGATYENRQAGSIGEIGCFSFHPRKTITTGEGGVVATNNPVIAQQVKMLRNHGINPESANQDFVLPGYNYRMTDIQGALGVSQMDKLHTLLEIKKQKAAIYDDLIANTQLSHQGVYPGSSHAYQAYIALLPENKKNKQAHFLKSMNEKGIQTTIGTIHIPMTSYYRTTYGYSTGDFPVTDNVASRAITLPLHDKLTEKDQIKVVTTLVELCDLKSV
ncbi:DegT/DnrJ/EryC1/StrS family aminotransferase [Candidatus Latescibacterota bacterium]